MLGKWGSPKKWMMIQLMKPSESVLSGYRSIFIFLGHFMSKCPPSVQLICGSKSSQTIQETSVGLLKVRVGLNII